MRIRFSRACLYLVTWLIVACTGSSDTQVPLPDVASLSSLAVASADGPPGRLLVLGVDEEIVTMRPDGTNRVILAEPAEEVERAQPTWSPDGRRVAWTERTAAQDTFLLIADLDEGTLSEWPSPVQAVYIAWSPDGEHVAVTGNDGAGNLLLAVARSDGEITVIEEGAPLYFDWAPDGSELLARVAGRFEYLAIDGSRRTPVPASGEFRFGAHLGDSIILGTARDVGEALAVADQDGAIQRELLRYSAPMAFVVDDDNDRVAVMNRGSPDSQLLAQVEETDLPIIAPDQLVVVDATDGTLGEVSRARIIAWSWSPNGNLLLFSTVEFIDGVERLVWHTWDGIDTTTYTPFSPTGTFGSQYLAYFDQFARSVSFWAPDGSAFVYAGGSSLDDAGIWVQEVTAGGPELVSPGQVAVWSPAP